MNHFAMKPDLCELEETCSETCGNCIHSHIVRDMLLCRLYTGRVRGTKDNCVGDLTGVLHVETFRTLEGEKDYYIERGLYDDTKYYLISETEANDYGIRALTYDPYRITDQFAKADAGKPKLTLVPRQIIFDIAKVREYGNQKYGDPDNWKTVSKERYRDAAFRHFMAYLDDPEGVDEESGLPHLWHLCTNCAFLCELEAENYEILENYVEKPERRTHD